MSAPATEQPPVEEQPTQPLERGRVTLGRYIWQSGLIVFPIIPAAAIGTGALLREFALATEDQRFYLTVTLIAGVLVTCGVVVFVLARRASSEDTGSISLWRED